MERCPKGKHNYSKHRFQTDERGPWHRDPEGSRKDQRQLVKKHCKLCGLRRKEYHYALSSLPL